MNENYDCTSLQPLDCHYSSTLKPIHLDFFQPTLFEAFFPHSSRFPSLPLFSNSMFCFSTDFTPYPLRLQLLGLKPQCFLAAGFLLAVARNDWTS